MRGLRLAAWNLGCLNNTKQTHVHVTEDRREDTHLPARIYI